MLNMTHIHSNYFRLFTADLHKLYSICHLAIQLLGLGRCVHTLPAGTHNGNHLRRYQAYKCHKMPDQSLDLFMMEGVTNLAWTMLQEEDDRCRRRRIKLRRAMRAVLEVSVTTIKCFVTDCTVKILSLEVIFVEPNQGLANYPNNQFLILFHSGLFM